MMAYYYNGGELQHYEDALSGSYYLYKPTDEECESMMKELDEADIAYEEKKLELRKQGMSDDEAEIAIDYPDLNLIFDKYPGHNPPSAVIIEHINNMKEARNERVFLTTLFMFILYSTVYILRKKRRDM